MPRFPRNHPLNIIFLTTLAGLLAFPIISPALPAMRAALNIPTENIGLVMTAYSLPAFLFVPLTGLLADRLGKKIVLVPSLFLFAAAGGSIMLAPDLEWVLCLRFVQGIGGSCLVSLNFALAGDLFQGRDRVRATGYIAALQNVGSGLLPILGGALASIAWFYPFALPLIGIPIGIYIIYFLEPAETKSDASTGAFIGYAWRHLMDRRVIELLAMTAGFIFVGFGAFVTYMPLFLKDTFATPEILIGVVLAARSVSGVIVATKLSKFTERYSYRTLVSGAFISLGTGMVIVPFMPNVWAIMLTAVIYGGAFAIIRPTLQLLLIEIAPSDLRATFASAGSFFLPFGQTIAPIAAGFMLVLSGYQGLYFAAAAFAFLFAGFAATTVVLRRA